MCFVNWRFRSFVQYSYGTVNSIFVEIQPDSTNIKNDPRIMLSLEFCNIFLKNSKFN